MSRNLEGHAAATLTPEHFWKLMGLVEGYRVSQAIFVVARLGIADLLVDGPRGSDELARATDTNEGALYRVLRFLAGVGVFAEVARRRFALTALGAGLRSDIPGSVRPMVLMLLDDSTWMPWAQLMHSVRTGETAFEHVHGVGKFEYLRDHPDSASTFDAAMTNNSARSGSAITDAYDFSGISQLVDVGGGHGRFLATILQKHPTLHGVLFDLPDVVAGAPSVLTEAGVADRCTVTGGDFFAEVAPGDVYILRQIIHDWDDARAIVILQNCRRAMQGAGRVLVVERVVGEDYRQDMSVLHVDMEMLVNLGGLQRTEDEYRSLFTAADLRLNRVVPLNDPQRFTVFEAVPA